MSMNVPIPTLRAFLRVAELGSFSRAARSLGISQPALSRTIRRTEDALGVRLFDRDTRNLTLTAAGTDLQETARRLTMEIDRGYAAFEDFLQGKRGRITVSTLPSIAATVFPEVLRRFHDQHPGVEIQVRDGSQEPVLADVLAGRCDLALTMRPDGPEDVRFEPLMTDGLLLGARRDDPLAAEAEVPWSALVGRPFIAMATTSSIRRMTDAAFATIGVDVIPRHVCGYPTTAASLAAAGLGVTALPRSVVPAIPAETFAELVFRPLKGPEIGRSIGILTRIGRSTPPLVDELIRLLRTVRTAA